MQCRRLVGYHRCEISGSRVTAITDAGLLHLSALNDLEYLDLAECAITGQ